MRVCRFLNSEPLLSQKYPPKQFSQARALLFVANGDKCAYSDEIGLQPPKDNMYIYERIILYNNDTIRNPRHGYICRIEAIIQILVKLFLIPIK